MIGLGSSYEFRQTAKDIDLQLENMVNRLVERLDCDVDYDAEVKTGLSRWLKYKSKLKQAPSADVVSLPSVNANTGNNYGKSNPYRRFFTESKNNRSILKDIRHIEISLEDSGISYQPGDSLGVWFKSDPSVVKNLLDILSIPAEEVVTVDDKDLTIEALVERFEITQSYPTFLKAYAALIGDEQLAQLAEDKTAARVSCSTTGHWYCASTSC